MLNIILFIMIITMVIFIFPDGKVTIVDNRVTSRPNTNVYRGWAMLIIMICHVTGEWLFKPFTPLGGIGVAMFLFLSGFGLSESYKKNGLNKFGQKKLLRLVLPYVSYCMCNDRRRWELEAITVGYLLLGVCILVYRLYGTMLYCILGSEQISG